MFRNRSTGESIGQCSIGFRPVPPCNRPYPRPCLFGTSRALVLSPFAGLLPAKPLRPTIIDLTSKTQRRSFQGTGEVFRGQVEWHWFPAIVSLARTDFSEEKRRHSICPLVRRSPRSVRFSGDRSNGGRRDRLIIGPLNRRILCLSDLCQRPSHKLTEHVRCPAKRRITEPS
jgi:hypothetical protein